MSQIIAIAADAQSKEDALTIAVRDHGRFVFKVAFSVLRNRDDAEDAAQETFLRAMKHVREFAKVDDPRAWLARTAWRIAIDRVRRKPHASLDDQRNEHLIAQLRAAESIYAVQNAARHGAEAVMISGEMTALLQSLIAALPPELRDVITLSSVEDMTSAEIGTVLGISAITVRTRLLRARQLLKEKIVSLLRVRERPDKR